MPSPARSETDGASAIPPMYTPSQMRMLRIAVIGMGVVLLLGFATVIGRIVWLVNAAPKPSTEAATAPTPLANAAPIALPKGAKVVGMALSGSRLAVHFESPNGPGIRIVDLGAGGSAVTLPIVVAP